MQFPNFPVRPVQYSTIGLEHWTSIPNVQGFDSHRDQTKLSACPVWMHYKSNITNIISIFVVVKIGKQSNKTCQHKICHTASNYTQPNSTARSSWGTLEQGRRNRGGCARAPPPPIFSKD